MSPPLPRLLYLFSLVNLVIGTVAFMNAGLLVPMAQSPDEFMVFVAGGAGKHSAYIPTFGSTRPVTQVVATANGVPARRLDDFRR